MRLEGLLLPASFLLLPGFLLGSVTFFRIPAGDFASEGVAEVVDEGVVVVVVLVADLAEIDDEQDGVETEDETAAEVVVVVGGGGRVEEARVDGGAG